MRSLMGWILVLVVALVAGCGAGVPDQVVEQAIWHQLSGVDSPLHELVGQQELGSRLKLLEVEVESGRSVKVPNPAGGDPLPGKVVSGSYTLRVQPLGQGQAYRRLDQPFKLTLVSDQLDPPTWRLVTPAAGARSNAVSDLAQDPWQLVEFMPTPTPTPAPEFGLPESEPDLVKSSGAEPTPSPQPEDLSPLPRA